MTIRPPRTTCNTTLVGIATKLKAVRVAHNSMWL